MSSQIVSVNVGMPQEIVQGDRVVTTGIFKSPVAGPVAVRATGLTGDGQADLTVHGGVDKAVYVYPAAHYAYWERELRRELSPGYVGENLTVAAVDEADVSIGDVFRVGSAVCQASEPRAPCSKLALRMQMPNFPKLFLRSLRTGFYLRVLEDGVVTAGQPMERVERADASMSVRDVVQLAYFARDDVAGNRRAAAIEALPDSWRATFEKRGRGEREPA